jgi:DNA polymerase-3 subunit epsilon
MILFYDTETTGLPDFKARSIDPIQPRLVQLALVTCADDGTEIEHVCVLVRPDGWTITPELTAIHGISHERAMDEGIPEERATAMFIMNQGRCALRVAHNESFDRRIMRIAMTRLGLERDFIEHIEARPSACTCQKAQSIVNMPPTSAMLARGMTGPKPPKLVECIQHFFGEELSGAHDALVDARARARIYFEMNKPPKAGQPYDWEAK